MTQKASEHIKSSDRNRVFNCDSLSPWPGRRKNSDHWDSCRLEILASALRALNVGCANIAMEKQTEFNSASDSVFFSRTQCVGFLKTRENEGYVVVVVGEDETGRHGRYTTNKEFMGGVWWQRVAAR